MRVSAYALTLGALIVTLACGEPAGPGPEVRFAIQSLSAPTALAAASPLEIELEYTYGACYRLTDLSHTIRRQVIEVEVRGRHVEPPRGSGCPDILLMRDTSIVVRLPPTGTVTVRGLQPAAAPIEVVVQVSP